MMNHSVVSPAYLSLQKEILEIQQQWEQKVVFKDSHTFVNRPGESALPFVLQVDLPIEAGSYIQVIQSLSGLLQRTNPNLGPQLERIAKNLTDEKAARWMQEALSFNSYYFTVVAVELAVDEWLLYFLAEQAIRPFLRAVAKQHAEMISARNTPGVCPCCGEPVRLAFLEPSRQKMQCPRCHMSWPGKRTSCSHCGCEEQQAQFYLSVEDEEAAQIHVCEECSGYVKVIDTRKMLTKSPASLLDLETIHLDLIAQERGFGLGKGTA